MCVCCLPECVPYCVCFVLGQFECVCSRAMLPYNVGSQPICNQFVLLKLLMVVFSTMFVVLVLSPINIGSFFLYLNAVVPVTLNLFAVNLNVTH